MSQFEITFVSPQVRDWNSTAGGPMKGYRVNIRDEQGNETQNVEWSRKATSQPPTVGQKIDATIDTTGQYGPKLKVTPSGGGFGGGGGRGKGPEERKSIQMMHAQKCAVEALKLAAEHGQYTPPAAADVVQQVKTLAQSFYGQIEEVAK